MAHSARRDSPELPDFSLLKRLVRDQLIYLLEQVGTRPTQHYTCVPAGDQRWVRTAGSALHLLHSLFGPFSKIFGIGRCSKVQYGQRAEPSDLLALSTLTQLLLFVCLQMTYESWREQVEEGEQKARQAEIGNVFLIDRGTEPRLFKVDAGGTVLSFHSNTIVV
ncbi:hypothetical protein GOODEAATRI_024245 [Goodea atripinnis]|uniref:Uncharacterized protein n=1 Tax=Goodea atripinnis TaxID=208336 RepID=A0ABV0Q0M1_9TELE